MTNTREAKIAPLRDNNRISTTVLLAAAGTLSRLPDKIVEQLDIETTDDYGVVLRWGTSCMEIRQASASTLFVWFTFNRHKADKITTAEERVFTDEDTLFDWIVRHAEELG